MVLVPLHYVGVMIFFYTNFVLLLVMLEVAGEIRKKSEICAHTVEISPLEQIDICNVLKHNTCSTSTKH